MAVWWWALEAGTRRGMTGDVTEIEVRWNTRYNYSALLCNTGVPALQARSPTQCDINTTSQCRTSPPLQQDELAQHLVFYPPVTTAACNEDGCSVQSQSQAQGRRSGPLVMNG